jgi:hypothetical protein
MARMGLEICLCFLFQPWLGLVKVRVCRKMNIRVRVRVEMMNMMKFGCLLVMRRVDDDCLVFGR